MAAKKFTIAGTSMSPATETKKSVRTFRFATGALNIRVNMLNHKGHGKVNLVDLPKPMTQVQAIAWLIENEHPGAKSAVVATRSTNPRRKTDVLLEGRELAGVA